MTRDTEALLNRVRAALVNESRIDLAHHPAELSSSEGTLTITAEVSGIAAKKLMLARAAAVEGVDTIIDRVRVRPAKRMGDGAVRDALRDALLQEPAFGECALRERSNEEVAVVRDVPGARGGSIEFEVDEGVVVLNGELPSLEHKRLAGVLAWWVPGSRDVVNGIAVEPPERDADSLVTDAVRMVFEKDPFVDASLIRVFTRRFVVELEGVVGSDAERAMAEADAWYVFGVADVINRLATSTVSR